MIKIKRAYDDPQPRDGCRVLVDRLWPRGISKEAAAVDRWMKEIAPSDELRQWFDHDPDKWDAFRQRYARELRRFPAETEFLREKSDGSTVTLIYAAKDTKYNNAVALRDYIRSLNEPF